MLYAIEAAGHSADTMIRDFWREFPGEAEGREYADEVVRGLSADLSEADRHIRAASQNWRLERMTAVDRNILRLGTWELLYKPDVPRAVIIDEAVEMAKRYGNEGSGAFVNGVLERIANDSFRRDEPPKEEPR
jgi:N utilization substance protein B